MSAPSWITVGAEVAVVRLDGTNVESWTAATIARVGKRDVVVADTGGTEYRFNMSSHTWRGDGLEARSGSSFSRLRTELHARHSPESNNYRLAARRAQAKSAAKSAVYGWERGEKSAREVAQAFTDLANWEAGA